MQTTDWITAIVALYAAVISSYLGYREIRKERRRIKMILEYMTYREIVRLIVVNSGHRPITITEISAAVFQKGPGGTEQIEGVPKNAIFSTLAPNLPALLSDGQIVIFELGGTLSQFIKERFKEDGKVLIELYDGEGNLYTKYEKRLSDAKWGRSEKVD